MMQDLLTVLCRRLFGRTQCKPAESPGDTEATGSTGLQDQAEQPSDSKETSRSDVTPKKTILIIAPSSDLQQVLDFVTQDHHQLRAVLSCRGMFMIND